MTMDKETRKALIERYLEAETTPDEEMRLREWFATHPADEDEREFALLIGMYAPCGHCLPETDAAEAEFDRILEEGERTQRHRKVRWAAVIGVAVAAGLALLLWLAPVRSASDNALTPIQIAEGVQQMMLLDIGDIESIVVTPTDSYAVLTARLKDGNTCSYILKCNDDEGTTTLLAYSSNQ